MYPGANHTRFEHSIGYIVSCRVINHFQYYWSVLYNSVCYIASELMKHLMSDSDSNVYRYIKSQKESENLIDYEMCVKVAALCHDLG